MLLIFCMRCHNSGNTDGNKQSLNCCCCGNKSKNLNYSRMFFWN